MIRRRRTRSAGICESFGKAAQRGNWESTDRSDDILAAEAIKEVRQAITSDPPIDPGPASLELAVRAAYPLVLRTARRGPRYR